MVLNIVVESSHDEATGIGYQDVNSDYCVDDDRKRVDSPLLRVGEYFHHKFIDAGNDG